MEKRRLIVDTTLRDGEQSPFVSLKREEKIRLARRLDEIGVYQIEAGIPAMGMAEQHTIEKIMELRTKSRISVWCRLQVPDVRAAIQCRPDIIHVSVPVSRLHIDTMMEGDEEWLLRTLEDVLNILCASGCRFSAGFEDATRMDTGFGTKSLPLLESAGADMIRTADTAGIAAPFAIRQMIRLIRENTDIPIEIHAHNDFGMAKANTAEALKEGAVFADTTLGGVGERSGNCDLAGLLTLIGPLYDTGIREEAAQEVTEEFSSMICS